MNNRINFKFFYFLQLKYLRKKHHYKINKEKSLNLYFSNNNFFFNIEKKIF